jgi:3-oxoadipate enol-lactonase
MWDPQLPALDQHRVVTIDHPGHGDAPLSAVSSVRDLADRVLEEVDGSFSFVGLSLGAAIGVQLALDAPDRVDRLVLACTSARFGEPQQWLDRAAVVRSEGLEAIVDALLGRWFTPSFDDVPRFRAMFLSVDAEGYARCCEALAVSDARATLASIAAPTLVIAGAEDPTSPPAEMEALARAIPDARFEVLDGAAHLANVESAEAFNQLLKEHL